MRLARAALWIATGGMLAAPLTAAARKAPAAVPVSLAWPPASADYKLQYVGSISSPADFAIRKGFLARLGELFWGADDRRQGLSRPFAVKVDPQGTLLVADPGAKGVHMFDPNHHKYKVLRGPSRQPFKSPIGLDSDSGGNIYVTDSEAGMIFVFDSQGRFQRFLGRLRGGEGRFKRPTGIAVDRDSGKLYLTDTLRHKVLVLNRQGEVEQEWGARGEGPGQFNFPTDIALTQDRLFVLDAMNFRVQIFSRDHRFLTAFGSPKNEPGGLLRPKALAVDERNRLVLVVDSVFEVVQAFDFDGRLAFAFGHPGRGPGEFDLSAGVCTDSSGRILVADSYNRRVQIFRWEVAR